MCMMSDRGLWLQSRRVLIGTYDDGPIPSTLYPLCTEEMKGKALHRIPGVRVGRVLASGNDEKVI